MKNKKTKIVCTLGPSSFEERIIEQIIKKGMNVARINFSHNTHEENGHLIEKVRKISEKLGVNIGIMADLQGPKIRLGDFPDTEIKENQEVIFTSGDFDLKKKEFPIQYKDLWKDVKKGNILRIADGLFEFKVLQVENKKIHAKVLNGGILKKRKGINSPDSSISTHPLTEKDKKDLKFALSKDVDFIALSFVRKASDIEDLRIIADKEIFVISKIERHEAVENLESIAKASDGLMVARGDLGVEIDFAEVPIVQKKLVHLGNLLGKPVITATQVFYSMTKNPMPTRAEVSDAANAVFDFTDAVMLSDETASGKHPVRSVEFLSRVLERAEETATYSHFHANRLAQNEIPENNAIAFAACQMSEDTGVNTIAIFSDNLDIFNQVFKHRPPEKVYCFTNSERIKKSLSLVWGANLVFLKTSDKEMKKVLKGGKVISIRSKKDGEEILSMESF